MKKLLLISSFLILSSTVGATSVGGSIGGWQVVSNVASGIGAKITATKEVMVNGTSKVVTGTANIMPNPSNMGKFMARLGGAAVVTEAMNQILNGVDYVMDPANNTVTYHNKDSQISPTDIMPWHPYVYYSPDLGLSNRSSESAVVDFVKKYFEGWGYYNPSCSLVSSSSTQTFQWCTGRVQGSDNQFDYGIRVNKVSNPAYDPAAEDESKPITVPLSDVSSQVLDQAQEDIKAGNVASPAVTLSRAVAQDIVQEAETDDTKARPIATELDKNISYPSDTDSDGTVTTPEVIDPVTGEVVKPAETSSIAMQFPKACEWFPQLCLFIDWMQKPQELDEPDLPTKEIEKKEIDEELIKISSSSCPAPIDVNIPLPVFNTTYTDSISVSDYCPKIEKLAPVLQLLAFVLAIMIIKDI